LIVVEHGEGKKTRKDECIYTCKIRDYTTQEALYSDLFIESPDVAAASFSAAFFAFFAFFASLRALRSSSVSSYRKISDNLC